MHGCPACVPVVRLEGFNAVGISVDFEFKDWRGRDGNDPSVDIAKDGRPAVLKVVTSRQVRPL